MTDDSHAKSRAIRVGLGLALVGAGLGIGFGLLAAGGLTATGFTSADLPPLASAEETVETTPTPTPEPTTQAPPDAAPQPELDKISSPVAPGERFTIAGRLPESADGTVLIIEVQDGKSGPWDEFPVQLVAADGGRFETKIWTSRTGERTFRVIDPRRDGDDRLRPLRSPDAASALVRLRLRDGTSLVPRPSRRQVVRREPVPS